MNIMLNFMDKIYSDDKAMTTIYIVGAVLLFIFIVLLIFSLRKTNDDKNVKIIDETENNKDDSKVEEEIKDTIVESDIKEKAEPILNNDEHTQIEEKKTEDKVLSDDIFEKTTIIPLSDVKADEPVLSKEENIGKALENVEKPIEKKEEPVSLNEEETAELKKEIPDVDDFVNDIMKKTYEKNEQFSSVYVNDNTMKLDEVMDKINLDKDVKEELTGSSIQEKNESVEEVTEPEDKKEIKEENKNTLDDLKTALDNKKEEVKTETTAINKEDLLNKLNSLKSNK